MEGGSLECFSASSDRDSGGDGRPEFPPVVPVFDLAFRERSIRFSYESSSAHDL